MDIKVTVEIPALDRLVDAMQAQIGLPDRAPAKAPATTRKQPEALPVEAAKDEPAAGTGEQAGEAEMRDRVKTAALKFQSSNGRDAFKAKLEEFGAPNLSGIPADRLADFLAAVSG